MDIDGTVTVSLSDYSKLHRLAKKGVKTLALHQELLDRVSLALSAIVYDPELPPDQAQKVVGHIKALSRSLPQINFYQDAERNRILLEVADDH